MLSSEVIASDNLFVILREPVYPSFCPTLLPKLFSQENCQHSWDEVALLRVPAGVIPRTVLSLG